MRTNEIGQSRVVVIRKVQYKELGKIQSENISKHPISKMHALVSGKTCSNSPIIRAFHGRCKIKLNPQKKEEKNEEGLVLLSVSKPWLCLDT